MSARARVLTFVTIVAVLVAVAGFYVVSEGRAVRAERASEPDTPGTPVAAVVDGPRIVFRHTGLDNEYGVVAMVPLAGPGGPRAFTGDDL